MHNNLEKVVLIESNYAADVVVVCGALVVVGFLVASFLVVAAFAVVEALAVVGFLDPVDFGLLDDTFFAAVVFGAFGVVLLN